MNCKVVGSSLLSNQSPLSFAKFNVVQQSNHNQKLKDEEEESGDIKDEELIEVRKIRGCGNTAGSHKKILVGE